MPIIFHICIACIMMTKLALADIGNPSYISEYDGVLEAGEFYNTATIILFDRNFGQSIPFEVSLTKPIIYEDLVIRLLSCWKETREQWSVRKRALLEIYKIQDNQSLEKVFYDWLFSEHVMLNDFVHNKFNILLKDCSYSQELE